MPIPGIDGVILAGGRSRRMGGADKALQNLAGRPLLAHVIDRIRPQVGHLWLSVASRTSEYEPFGLRQLPDPRPGSHGPLGGLLSALRQTASGLGTWLLLVPCDAPFLPGDLAERLYESTRSLSCPGAIVRSRGELQPTFSLWHVDLLQELERAVMELGMRGFKQFLDGRELALVDWAESTPDAFFNINDSASLSDAERRLAEPEVATSCSA
jgi:molybdopterin-guanine dinucleotide biosynthesis protein A